jgi:hypothetical protein
MLHPIVQTLPHVLNSTLDIVRDLDAFTMPPGLILSDVVISVRDVVSLYPNIDIDRGLAAVRVVCDEHPSLIHHHQASFLLELLALVLRYHITGVQGRFFLQQVGTAMGTSCAGDFGDIFLHVHEREMVASSPLLLMYRRFRDDCLALFANLQGEIDFWHQFNSKDELISAVVDTKNPNAFLDLNIYKGPKYALQRKLDHSCFVKPSKAFIYLSRNTYHTESAKTNFIGSELRRFVINNTEFKNFAADRDALQARLKLRGYQWKTMKPFFTKISYADRADFLSATEAANPSAQRRVALIAKFDPYVVDMDLPSILHANWHLIEQDLDLAPLFDKPVVAFQNQPNVQQMARRLRQAL